MQISIIGLGLLGGSMALALKGRLKHPHIIGVENNAMHAQKALDLKIVDEIQPMTAALEQAEMVVLAVPVNAIAKLINPVLDLLPGNCLLIDLGSTKKTITDIAAAHPKREQYVAMHPVAGTEYTGPEAAFAALLPGKNMIICDQESSAKWAIEKAQSLCNTLDMPISYMSSEEHDMQMAYVSHLSHISAFALSLTVLDKARDEKHILDMAGSGFASTVRLAKSDPAMWAPIFSQNKKHLKSALNEYLAFLSAFQKAILSDDEEQKMQLMQQANKIRKILK